MSKSCGVCTSHGSSLDIKNIVSFPFRPYAPSITEDCILKVETYVAMYSGRPLHYSLRFEPPNSILGESIILIDQSMILSMAGIDKHFIRNHELESRTLLNAFQSFAVSQSEL